MNKDVILSEIKVIRKELYDNFQRLDRLCRVFELAIETDKAEEYLKTEMEKKEIKNGH